MKIFYHVLWYATYRADCNPLVKKSNPTLQRNDDSEDSMELTNQTAEVTTTDKSLPLCRLDA